MTCHLQCKCSEHVGLDSGVRLEEEEEASLVWRLIADGREWRMHRNTFTKKEKKK